MRATKRLSPITATTRVNRTSKSESPAPVISKSNFDAVLFDMDGVVTRTAVVHTKAWKYAFDSFLKERLGNKFKPFSEEDYLDFVDGKPREDGVTSFLKSRKITLPMGQPGDKPGFCSVYALGNLKNKAFLEIVHKGKIEAYETTIDLIRSLKRQGFKVAIISASKNMPAVLKATNLTHIFDAHVDGVSAAKKHLAGKPHPDTFLEAARQLGVLPSRAIVVEDAAAGVEAGKNGKFGLVIGVARSDDTTLLKKHGASMVVHDLGDVVVEGEKADRAAKRGTALSELDVSEENWILSFDGFDPATEGQREALCALGNGYFCTRAANPESHADGLHYPGTYIAAGYNRLRSKAGKRNFEFEELVNMPNWLALTFKIKHGSWFTLKDVEILEYKQTVNLREGILSRNFTFRDQSGHETEVKQRWLVSMRRSHLAALECKIIAKNWSGPITIRSAIDGRVENTGTRKDPRLKKQHLSYVEGESKGDRLYLKMATKQSQIGVAMAARHQLLLGTQKARATHEYVSKPKYVAQETSVSVKQGQTLTFHKTVSVHTSKDRAISEVGIAARDAVADAPDFAALVSEQKCFWNAVWNHFDLFIETREEHSKMIPSLVLHLHSFHIVQTASLNTIDLDTGVPARGWTGEGYQGHIFWDDLLVFPFINLRLPDITQALLRYRYRRLGEARKIARSLGALGARFPWQSGSTGREETPMYLWIPDRKVWVNDYSRHEIHVNAAIAYNVWQYYQVTANLDFMQSCGAELLIEIARFFATYAKHNKETDRYELHGVVGPDEFHNEYPGADKPGINNNAYTNIMAVWSICRALDLQKILPSDMRQLIFSRMGVKDDELQLWERVSKRMYVPFLSDGVISQFDGWEKLKEYPWRKDGQFEPKKLKELLDDNNWTLNPYRVAKQADVLMLFYIFSERELKDLFQRLGYPFDEKSMAQNAEYYMPRTANASTLSRIAHTWVLARLDRCRSWRFMYTGAARRAAKDTEGGGWPRSWDVFFEALGSDYLDIQGGTTREGIHVGAMAGSLDIMQRCYGGIVTRDDLLSIDPQLPDALTRLTFSIRYRGQALTFDLTHQELRVTARHSSVNAIKIEFKRKVYELEAGGSLTLSLRQQSKQKAKGKTAAA